MLDDIRKVEERPKMVAEQSLDPKKGNCDPGLFGTDKRLRFVGRASRAFPPRNASDHVSVARRRAWMSITRHRQTVKAICSSRRPRIRTRGIHQLLSVPQEWAVGQTRAGARTSAT